MKNKIQIIRNINKISQYKLAEITGLSQSQISKIENDKRNLKNNEVIKVAHALNVNVADLFF